MNFSFGIITNGLNDHYLQIIIQSIEDNSIPHYEIIIIGNTQIKNTNNIKIINFDETIKENWITKKKKYNCSGSEL